MGGIGLQQLFIFVFMFLTAKFHQELLRQTPTERIRQALILLYVVYAALILITVGLVLTCWLFLVNAFELIFVDRHRFESSSAL